MMYFLLLSSALAVAGLGWLLRRRFAAPGQTLMVLGIVGCVAVLIWQVRQSVFPPAVKMPNRAHAVVSFFLANQIQQAVAGQRGTIVVLLPPPSLVDAETAQTYANTLSAPLLRGHPELDVQVITLESAGKAANPGSIPATAFKQAIEKSPRALAFASYAGVPPDATTLFPLNPPNTPFFVFDPVGSTNWLAAVKQGRIRSVIVPRPGVNAASQGGIAGDPGYIFSQLYLMVTAANADETAALLGSPAGDSSAR